MRDDEILALLVCGAGIGAVVAMWSVYHTKRAATSQARLDVIRKSLEHPAMDDAARSQLVRLLTQEQQEAHRPLLSRFGGAGNVRRILRGLLVGGGWVTFLFCASILFCRWLGVWDLYSVEPVIVFGILGFIALTLPTAMSELLRARTSEAER